LAASVRAIEAPRRRPVLDEVGQVLQLGRRRVTSGEHDVDDVVADLLVDVDLVTMAAQAQDVLGLKFTALTWRRAW